ncbi:MAG: hypothetical protein SNH27_12725 [Rikenellaceae bacterium]
MEIINGILYIEHEELVQSEQNPQGVMSESMYKKLLHTEKVLRRLERGGNGRKVQIEYNSVPQRYRDDWEAMNGDPYNAASKKSFLGQCKFDEEALRYYLGAESADGSVIEQPLDAALARKYANEASVLGTIHRININSKEGSRRIAGRGQKVDWDATVRQIYVEEVLKAFPHKLPHNPRSLQRKVKKFVEEGYESLIHGGFGHDNSTKRTVQFDRLAMALYTMPNKPFNSTAYENYLLFLKGAIQIYDRKTGEMFQPGEFEKCKVSEKTFWRAINNPLHRVMVDEQRNDNSYNLNINRPFQRRRTPNFSLSKISMDDRDLPRKMHNGNRVKAYYAYDVKSGCVIGAAYSKTKDEELFLDCLRDMFRNITKNGWGIPAEVEVENHLVNKFFDDLAVMFPHVKICIPGNHREKRAEHLNRAKKYTTEKKNGHALGRWWARSEAYKQPQQKVNDEYVEKTFNYEDLVRDDMADIREYNLSVHPRKIYGGMSRWQVLTDFLNQDLKPINNGVLARYIGYKTSTSIRNSKEVQVQGLHFQLANVEDLGKLQANNRKVDAYYLYDTNDAIAEVYIYQGDKFISRCQYIAPYNEARAEWTEADEASFTEQSKYDAQYRKVVKESKVDIPTVEFMEEIEAPTYTPKPKAARKKRDSFDVGELLAYNSESTIARADNNI